MLLLKNVVELPEGKPLDQDFWNPSVSKYVKQCWRTWNGVGATTPVKYREVPLQEVYQLVEDLEAIRTFNCLRVDNIETLLKQLESIGVKDPEGLRTLLTKEYTVQASLVFHSYKLRSSLPYTLHGQSIADYWLTSRHVPSLFSFLLLERDEPIFDNLTQHIDEFKDRHLFLDEEGHRMFNFILARQARTMEILLSNPELIVFGLKESKLSTVLTAIYLKWALNHDDYYTLDYFMGLLKTTVETINNSPLRYYLMTTPLLKLVNSFYNNPVNLENKDLQHLYSTMNTIWNPPDVISSLSTLMVALERIPIKPEGYTAELNISRRIFRKEEEYTEYFLDHLRDSEKRDKYIYTPGYSGLYQFRTQNKNPNLPQIVLTLTVRDSREVEIPIFIGTHEDIDFTLLTPSTTKVMNYIRTLYSMEKPDPFLHYGDQTKFLVTPENIGFLPTLVHSLKYLGLPEDSDVYNPTQTLDIRTYLEAQPSKDKPSVYDRWYYFLLSAYSLITPKTLMEVMNVGFTTKY